MTIAAIATAQAVGGIGIIRISGEDACSIADQIFSPVSGKPVKEMTGYTAAYGYVYDGEVKLDEAVALVFRAPHSYTGEDVVEFSCHGGLYLMQRILRVCYEAGAKAAEPGEFTKRAFLNGKFDLTQAEAVASLIAAQGESSARASLAAHEGALSSEIIKIKHVLTTASAHMSAWVDYPDDEIPELKLDTLSDTCKEAAGSLRLLLERFDSAQAIMEGVDTVIAGRPNAGKSTLMNLLAGTEKSIVTEIPGTTRDIVEGTVRVGNAVLRLADTAGLRESQDTVEQIGISFARKRLERAGFVLAVFDNSQRLNAEDRKLLEALKDRPSVAVINKCDLDTELETDEIEKRMPYAVKVSAKTGQGYDILRQVIEAVLGTDQFDPFAPMIVTERQRACCAAALSCIEEAIMAMDAGLTMDAVNVSIDAAIEALLELTGERATDTIVDEIFSQFCVGK